MNKEYDNEDWNVRDDDIECRRGRRDTTRKMKHWVGDIDYEEIETYESVDGFDDIPTFERLKSRRKQRHEF